MSTNASTSLGASEHVSEHDYEYGPTPPGAQHEHTDIDPSVGYKFALWLAVAMLMSVAIVFGTFRFFEGRTKAADAVAQKYPLAVGIPKAPPAPNLQNQPFKDIYNLRHARNREADQLRVGRQGRRHCAHPDRSRDGNDAATRISGAHRRQRRAQRRHAGQFVGADHRAAVTEFRVQSSELERVKNGDEDLANGGDGGERDGARDGRRVGAG